MYERNPFAETITLMNIMTGVNATGDVDVCRAKEIGLKIMELMTGIPVAQYTFKRNDQVTTLQSKSSVGVDGQPKHIDPELPFQRLIVASNAIDYRKALFRFELCSYPSALFDDTLMQRAPQKAVLANAIWTRLPPDIAGPTIEVQHVLDGGALLHRITWPHGFPTYQDICALYCDYMSQKVGPAIVVFGGYRIPSTKYTTRQRRTGGKVGIEVTSTGDMKLTMSKDVFLSNVANKQNFIDMLSHYLQRDGCLTEHAEEDADMLIAQTAVQSAATKNTVLVADDTDFATDLCSSEIPQHASIHAGTAVAGCLQYEGDILGVDDKGREPRSCPVMAGLPPTPDEPLRVIRCNCTTDYSTARRRCRKHSLGCSPACGQCQGIGCSNITAADISDEDDDDDDDDR